jgi:hypothetical protein
MFLLFCACSSFLFFYPTFLLLPSFYFYFLMLFSILVWILTVLFYGRPLCLSSSSCCSMKSPPKGARTRFERGTFLRRKAGALTVSYATPLARASLHYTIFPFDFLLTDPSIYISIYLYLSKAFLPSILLSIDLSIYLYYFCLYLFVSLYSPPLPARCAFVSYRCSKCLLMADYTALFVCVLSHVYARVLSAWKLFVFLSILQYIHAHQSSTLCHPRFIILFYCRSSYPECLCCWDYQIITVLIYKYVSLMLFSPSSLCIIIWHFQIFLCVHIQL